jgi:DNA end-binding protein Ku
MAARSAWKGYVKLGLVSVPVKAYTASASSAGEIRLNQLHSGCNARIQYKKTCPIHGEVKADEIVSGYEYAKDQYVVIDTDELDKLRTEDDKAVKIDTFVAADKLDPIYYSGKAYYLVPDGPVAFNSFAVMREAMAQEKKYAIARVVMHGKEQLVMLRSMENLIAMMVLDYDFQVTKPATFAEEAPKVTIAPEELQLAKTLIEAAAAKKFDLAAYKDVYTERLTQLIEAKVAGKEVVAPPAEEHAQVINLMDALKQSVAQLKQEETPAAKPPRKMAPSTGAKAAKTPKRKTS